MAKARKLAPTPAIRSAIRQLVRAGSSSVEIATEVNARFNNVNQTGLNRMIREESARQQRVDAIMSRDKRKTADLQTLVGCKGKKSQVRARITITWFDSGAGIQRTYGSTVILGDSGRLATLLNTAIAQVAADAVNRGYTPPTITSAQTAGSPSYRLEYVECT